jgi:membrane-associated phospholipid phosphatase
VEALWVRIIDRLSKVLFALTTGFVLVMEVITHAGYGRMAAILLCGGVGFVVATLLNAGIKWLFKKKRPMGDIKRTKNLLAPLMQYSFPSFHVQLGFTMTFIASWFFWDIHWAFIILFFALAIIVAYTRYILKAHDLIDIVGGAIIGIATGVLICLGLAWINNVYAAIGAVIASLLLFFYIPERYFSKKLGEKDPD